jgi:primosomal protein N' (replication factor Y)
VGKISLWCKENGCIRNAKTQLSLMKVLRVALDVPVAKLFDYLIDDASLAASGDRVVVPFGARQRVGVVVEVSDASSVAASRLKSVVRVLDDAPRLSADWLEQMRFLSSYYQRPFGETVAGALPARLRSLRPLPRRRRSASGDVPDEVRQAAAVHGPNPAQASAIERIGAALGSFRPFLLHGITGSGKTEVYLRLIADCLRARRQCLVLVPEISLTPQLEQSFRNRFPDAFIVTLHSALADTERAVHWLAAESGDAQIVLGTRLAALAPMPHLGLIVVDEEHDTSFKQQDGMRYSARDVAIYRAKKRGVPILLGSATPSLETYAHANSGRYRLIRLAERAVEYAVLPPVHTVDTRGRKLDQGLSETLKKALLSRLERGEQSLIFINRRGYAPVLCCPACGWVSGCPRCSSNLVLHLADRLLRCHHCGDQSRIPRLCPTCGNQDIHPFGRGTQRVEESLQRLFPDARVARVDRDSTRTKRAWETLLRRIHAGEADILVGTQMLAKGHDFPKVTLVGILNSDSALFAADYRAPERLFATLLQVAGRAGRANLPGVVLIQTEHPDHPLYRALAHHDFEEFAAAQLAEREVAGFPPYVFQAMLRAEAERIGDSIAFLRSASALPPAVDAAIHKVRIYDPVPMSLARLASRERAQLLVESSSRTALQAFLAQWVALLYAASTPNVRWSIDVDPIEF